mmetsp:Transcript_17544/g.28395  ORF Transcript_17544/g.28395 Transcript_17544/m.28395 type:complete len:273 (-) Transcript_17544:2823-3641(-)
MEVMMSNVLKRKRTLLAIALLAFWVYRRLKQRWEQRIILANFIVSLNVEGDGMMTVYTQLPHVLMNQIAVCFQILFGPTKMCRFLYQGSVQHRTKLMQELFEVHARIADLRKCSRFMVDTAENSRLDSRVPKAVCYARVQSSTNKPPTVMDVIESGGLRLYWHLGVDGFLRNYKFEKWLEALKRRVAKNREYMCIEYLFVDPEKQGQGLGTHMVSVISEEAKENNQSLMITISDKVSLDFFVRNGFSDVYHEAYPGDGGDDDFTVWVLWKDL